MTEFITLLQLGDMFPFEKQLERQHMPERLRPG